MPYCCLCNNSVKTQHRMRQCCFALCCVFALFHERLLGVEALAQLCRAILAMSGVTVRLSVTSWYRVKTNDRRIVRFSSPGSPRTVVFLAQISYGRSKVPWEHSWRGLQTRLGLVKTAKNHFWLFSCNISETLGDRTSVTIRHHWEIGHGLSTDTNIDDLELPWMTVTGL